jgi:hypothetical protein
MPGQLARCAVRPGLISSEVPGTSHGCQARDHRSRHRKSTVIRRHEDGRKVHPPSGGLWIAAVLTAGGLMVGLAVAAHAGVGQAHPNLALFPMAIEYAVML